MDRSPLHLALRETRRLVTSPRALVSLAAVVLVLGLSGPFNTFTALALPERLLYWLAIVVLTYGIGTATATLVLALLAQRITAVPLRVAITTLVCGVPVTLVTLGVNMVVYHGTPGIDPLRLWLYCTAIALAVVTVMTVSARSAAPTPANVEATAPSAPLPPAILARLPHPQRGRLVALSVKDHYVEVITERGSALVLMRLSDAIRETGPVPGLQIHRSHWVALDAVRRVVRSDGKLLVELPGGGRLPISRGYLAAARQAGLVV